MVDVFIAEYPGVVYLVVLGMGCLVGYFYKGNETKSALLIAGKLDMIAEKLDILFKKDKERNNRIGRLETSQAKQIQRCDDRENICPGYKAQQVLTRCRDKQITQIEKERNE
jgi:hypothetical protein